ncbi:hypothetical protein TNCV_1689211 [Trichonephila clavipes]|nr:hypothetical protein TNCV_1689211 [Trichonephila clavipes]
MAEDSMRPGSIGESLKPEIDKHRGILWRFIGKNLKKDGQLVTRYEERHASRGAQDPINNVKGQDWDSRRRVPERYRDGNWRDVGVVNRHGRRKRRQPLNA